MVTQPLNLADIHIGESGKVLGFQASNRIYRHKLLVMGLTPGTEFTVTRIAPLGDPIVLLVRGYALSLRKTEAKVLLVSRISS